MPQQKPDTNHLLDDWQSVLVAAAFVAALILFLFMLGTAAANPCTFPKSLRCQASLPPAAVTQTPIGDPK